MGFLFSLQFQLCVVFLADENEFDDFVVVDFDVDFDGLLVFVSRFFEKNCAECFLIYWMNSYLGLSWEKI